tara:strand:+ start:138 stop:461 length:324 start_codon:yes stop_codon:yes gene_type:complete
MTDIERPPQEDCHTLLQIVGDKTRLFILQALMNGPQGVAGLIESLGIEQSLLSHHLRILRDHGFVSARREGKSRIYQLTETARGENPNEIDLGCCRIDFPENLSGKI